MLSRLRPRIDQERSTYFLRTMGWVLLAGGTAHTLAVSYLYFSSGWPVHDRVGYIYLLGVVQLVAGALDLIASSLISRDRKAATRLVLVSALLITAYAIVIAPTYPAFSLLFKFAPPIYLLFHWWALLRIRADN